MNPEMEPGAPDNNETQPESLAEPNQNPLTIVEGGVATPEGSTVESADMAAIRERVKAGEELTAELYTAYQMAGEAIADTVTDPEAGALARLELQLACAQLLTVGGETDAAAETLNELLMTPEMNQYPQFAAKVQESLNRLGY